MPWTIEYTKTALTELHKLDKSTARRIVHYLEERVAGLTDPRSMGRGLSGSLAGLWRYRIGDYRVICDIQTGTLRIMVVRVGSRGKVYR